MSHPNRASPRKIYSNPDDCIHPVNGLELVLVLVRNAIHSGGEFWGPDATHKSRATYSVALIRWRNEPRLAWRFDGEKNHPLGWPSSSGYPAWAIPPRPLQMGLMEHVPLELHAQVLEVFRGSPYSVKWFRLGENGLLKTAKAPTFGAAIALLPSGPEGWERYLIEKNGHFVERGDPHGPRGRPSPDGEPIDVETGEPVA